MFGVPLMGTDLTAQEKKVSKCDVAGSGITLRSVDMTNGLILLTVILDVLVIIFVAGFKTDYLRMNAEREKINSDQVLGKSPLVNYGET